MQVGKQRRKHRVSAVRLSDVLIVRQVLADRPVAVAPGNPLSVNSCRESPGRLKSARPEKIPRAPGSGSPSCFSLTVDFASQNRTRRRPEDSDAVRLVSLEQFFVDRDDIVDGGREGIFRREPVVDRDNFHLREI